jgi:GLPGLI family protein
MVAFIPPSKNTSNMIMVDSGNVKIWYALNAVDIVKSETYDDLQILETGEYFSKYYSYFVYARDSLITDWLEKHPRAKSVPNWLGAKGKDEFWSEYYYSEYFKDFSKNILTEYARMPLHMKKSDSQYSENIPIQNWDIKDDTLTVANYLCQKATCKFRGRDYTAWFSMDIPIQNGPWKFGELPGLILKVYDKDMDYVFECVKIEFFKEKYPIKKYDYKNYEKIEREKLLKLHKNIHENYFGTVGFVSTTPFKKGVYNPLELE